MHHDERLEMRILGAIPMLAALSLAAGCAGPGPSPLPMGQAAYQAIPEHADAFEAEAAKIAAGDRLAIRVFGEPDLSGDGFQVETDGAVQVPLLGTVPAAGKLPRDFAADLVQRLAVRYIRDPHVTVQITARPRATYAVEGAVEGPGVFEAIPGATLLSALAQARSPKIIALTSDILILRTVNGQATGGRFNLADIRRGRAPDPQIIAGDKIVVPTSAGKAAYRDLLQALPILNVFYLLK